MQPVEWVLVVHYGPEAHRAAYGRQVRSDRYTKDYIQLSRRPEFLKTVNQIFGSNGAGGAPVPLIYRWPGGSTPGAFVFHSGDRPHLKWETSLGAPQAWKMVLAPGESTAETIPGDPSHLDFEAAENELRLLADRQAGQPYLMAIKLRDEPRILHLRAYLANPSREYAWADIRLAPPEVQALARQTSRRSALAASEIWSGGIAPPAAVRDAVTTLLHSENAASVIDGLDADEGRALTQYLRQPGYGLFFDPSRNHDAWLVATTFSEQVAASVDNILTMLEARFFVPPLGDAIAEASELSEEEVGAFRAQMDDQNYGVADSHVTAKTRGSAQKAFAEVVKANYGNRCAITDIANRAFLVAAHIVPWSTDQGIRLDPSNGICLSLLVDRAFETGHLQIEDDLTIRIDWDRVGDDAALRSSLELYDGRKLRVPASGHPNSDYLQRRRMLVAQS